MAKYLVIIDVDENILQNATGEPSKNDLQTQIQTEFGWLEQSGISLERIVENLNKDEELHDALIDEVIGKIIEDIGVHDVTAIFELLRFCPIENLIQFLPEERWDWYIDLKK